MERLERRQLPIIGRAPVKGSDIFGRDDSQLQETKCSGYFWPQGLVDLCSHASDMCNPDAFAIARGNTHGLVAEAEDPRGETRQLNGPSFFFVVVHNTPVHVQTAPKHLAERARLRVSASDTSRDLLGGVS